MVAAWLTAPARVLTDYFDSVTIVERDRFPKHQDRAGASVVTCAAGAGQRILEQLFLV